MRINSRAASRAVIGGLAVLNAALLFPGYPFFLQVFDDPETRAQAALALGALAGFAALAAWSGRLPLRMAQAGLLALALLNLAAAARVLAAFGPALGALLPELDRPGVGFWLFMGGNALIALAAGAALVREGKQGDKETRKQGNK